MLRYSSNLIRKVAFVSILALSAALSFGAPAGTVDANLTVGDFLVQYARSMHIVLPADASPSVAQAALQAVGVPAGDLELGRTLTHRDVVRIGRAAGLRITSKTPDKAFSQSEVNMFFEHYSVMLASRGTDGTDLRDVRTAASHDEGKGKGKGHTKGKGHQSPTEPD